MKYLTFFIIFWIGLGLAACQSPTPLTAIEATLTPTFAPSPILLKSTPAKIATPMPTATLVVVVPTHTPNSAYKPTAESSIYGQIFELGVVDITLSPRIAELMLADAQNRRIGYDPVTKQEVNDFVPQGSTPTHNFSVYLADKDQNLSEILMMATTPGKAVLTITGIAAGEYILRGEFADKLNNVSLFYAKENIAQGQIKTMTITIPQNSLEVPYPPQEVSAGIDMEAKIGQAIIFSGSFEDINPHDTHEITWDFGDNLQVKDTLTPSHTYTQAGIYFVTLTVTDSVGFADTNKVTVIVK